MYIETITFLVSKGYGVLKLGLYINYFLLNKLFLISVRKQMLMSPRKVKGICNKKMKYE